MTFRELQERLLVCLNQKVGRGEISERQLARLTGYTQPHIHNVLKRVRRLNAEVADAMLQRLQLSIHNLLEGEGQPLPLTAGAQALAPLWGGRVGPRQRFPEGADLVGYYPFPAVFLSRFVDPILLQLACDEDSMAPLLEPGDLILVDRAEGRRRHPIFENIYALSFGGRGAVCRCQRVGGALVPVAENSRCSSRLPDHLPLGRRDILEMVKGKVVWACRDMAEI